MHNPKDSIDLAIAGATLLGLISTALMWYRSSVEKSYAAQRDFNHLRNSISSLSASIDKLLDNQEEALEQLQKTQEKILLKIETSPSFSYRNRGGWTTIESGDEGPPTGPM
jgi:hypothetical protein